MMKKIAIHFTGTMMVIAALFSCSPRTDITASWKNPNAEARTIDKVLVAAMTNHTQARLTIENDMSMALQQNGYEPLRSIDILPPTFTAGGEPDKQMLLDKLNGNKVDAILTVALLNEETENRYAPGGYGYEPFPRYGYYGRFWGYYRNWYPEVYAPGYYAENKIYFIEINLYDASTEALIWSAQSETYNPSDLSSFSKDFAAIVVDKMQADGVIRHE